jgi:hypothetical protein
MLFFLQSTIFLIHLGANMKSVMALLLLSIFMVKSVSAGDTALSPNGTFRVSLTSLGTVAASSFNGNLLPSGYTFTTGTDGSVSVQSYNAEVEQAGYFFGGGASIRALYNSGLTLMPGQSLNWVQVITTNVAIAANNRYLDNGGSTTSPFYDFAYFNRDSTLPANQINFFDAPLRYESQIDTFHSIVWIASLYPVVVTNGIHVLTVENGISWGFIMTAVPEPEEWAMMLLGFGMVGYQIRRKRKENVPTTA